ncbi:MAG TPA: penicillin-binding protein 2 [Abditibacteriaceae bacterium]|jgi:cell division protein FtsI/penicillin-binding protein 2
MSKTNNSTFAIAVRPGTKRRIEGVVYFLAVPLLFLGYRFVKLQALENRAPQDGTTSALGLQTATRRRVIMPRRAEILAADGTAMAVTLDEYAVCANPRAVKEKEKMARLIAQAIGGSQDEYLQLLNKTTHADGSANYYVRLAKRVDESLVKKLKEMMKSPPDATRASRAIRRKFWEPITLEPTPRRNYPLGEFASQLIGFTTNDGQGADGLEYAWNKELGGKPGEVVAQVDTRNRPVPGFVQEWRAPSPGRSIVTTIDPNIQSDTDATLREIYKKYKPNFASAIVMRPRTGEIVAMSTAPSFDPNKRPKNIAEVATNRGLSFVYEPGSTFKIITAAAAVENVPDWRSHSFMCNGIDNVGGRPMRCWVNSTSQRRHGDEDLSEGIRDSCNFAMYGFARLIGAPRLLDYAKRFAIDEPVNLAGLREGRGYLAGKPQEWGARQLASFSFGQGMSITPLQLIRVGATIANDGVMMKPMLIKELRDEQNKVVQAFEPEVDRRVVKTETAHEVRDMMERVTREGASRVLAFVPGYQTAGKTGSAQKAEGPRGYAAGKFISSFMGFVPSRNPEFVILILADEPHGSHWGSEVCGPAFGAIASKAMLHLRLRQGTRAPAPSPALMSPPELARAE